MAKMSSKTRGFTIIEVMIVLAIAGLMLLLVFLAVPALQRTERNRERKQAVGFVVSEMERFYGDHGHYPLSSSVTCSSQPDCVQFVDGLQSDGLTKNYAINYTDNHATHTYLLRTGNSLIPAASYDHIVIFPAHQCNTASGVGVGDADYPVTSFGPVDNNFNVFAVYTFLETDTVYCTNVTPY